MRRAEVEVVFSGDFADEADFAQVGAGTAVGAAGGADVNGGRSEAGGADNLVELVHEVGEVALAFGEGEAAGGEGDAGHAAEAQAGDSVGSVGEAVLLEKRLY